jgi:hypothetical protein
MQDNQSVPSAVAAAACGSVDSPANHKSGVVIVGGGPAGYASAMMLARRGWTDITLVEAQADPTYADPDRSYGETDDCKKGPGECPPQSKTAMLCNMSSRRCSSCCWLLLVRCRMGHAA